MADPLSSVSGLSSGIDYRALVDQIVKLERRPAARLEAAIEANARRKTALNDFQALVQALHDAAGAMASPTAGAFASFAVTAPGKDAAGRSVLAATAGAGATPGTFGVRVTALASAQRWTGAAGVAPGQLLPAGAQLTLSRTDAASTGFPPITVGGDWTLARLRDEINRLNTGATPSGVTASIVTVGPTEQRLVLGATGAGGANGFALDDGGSGLLATLGLDAASRAANPALVQSAADAAFEIDGVAMTRATNTVGDAIAGVTLTLGAVGATEVTVERQMGAAADAASAFVEAYNKLVGAARSALGSKSAALYGDSLLRQVRSGVPDYIVAAAVPATGGGAAGVADDLTTLASLGMSVQKDGTLKLDRARFTAVAGARLENVQALLGDRMGALRKYADSLARASTGVIDQRELALESVNGRYTTRITAIDARLDARRAALLAQYSKFEASLGRLKTIGDSLSSQLAGLNKSRD
jgi:flagellar hook-associated protein 2